jgi:hypothetical protein
MIGWAIAISTVVVFPLVWYGDGADFSRAHAKRRTYWLNALRIGLSLAAVLAVVGPLGFHKSVASYSLAIAAALLFILPARWVGRLGGVEPKWALRSLENDIGTLISDSRRDRTPDEVSAMRSMMNRIGECRTNKTNELCDIVLANCGDWIDGAYDPSRLGLRSVREYELEQALYGRNARRPELDVQEATFRWRLYRAFGAMVDYGMAEQSQDARAAFAALANELNDYRRPDTEGFIDAVQESARAWLSSYPADSQWPPHGRLEDLGPAIVDGYSELWPSTTVFWGAELDADDRASLLGTAQPSDTGPGQQTKTR